MTYPTFIPLSLRDQSHSPPGAPGVMVSVGRFVPHLHFALTWIHYFQENMGSPGSYDGFHQFIPKKKQQCCWLTSRSSVGRGLSLFVAYIKFPVLIPWFVAIIQNRQDASTTCTHFLFSPKFTQLYAIKVWQTQTNWHRLL